MKKLGTFLLTAIIAASFVFTMAACSGPVDSIQDSAKNNANSPYSPFSGLDPEEVDLVELGIVPLVWNGGADRAVAVNIEAVQNTTRKNASGIKITSNAHSGDFPGIYFIWDSKQKDNGYLKVAGGVFTLFESFVLTSKEANTYWDFLIAPVEDQELTEDGCYVFFIPRANNNKKINMVFLGEWTEREISDPPPEGEDDPPPEEEDDPPPEEDDDPPPEEEDDPPPEEEDDPPPEE